MKKKAQLLKSKERKNRSEVSQFLHQIADKIESGQVTFRLGQEETALDLPANLILKVKVKGKEKKKKGLRHSLKIQVKWFDDDTAGTALELG
jgi:amphi-Trp domain-containing protein